MRRIVLLPLALLLAAACVKAAPGYQGPLVYVWYGYPVYPSYLQYQGEYTEGDNSDEAPIEETGGADGNINSFISERTRGSTKRRLEWEHCEPRASDESRIEYIKVNPDPPRKGSSVTYTAGIYLAEEVTGGYLLSEMYFVRGSKKILVQKKKYSICDMVGKSEGKSCPLQPGDHVLGFTKFLPKKTPTGRYKGTLTAVGEDGTTTLGCARTSMYIG